MTFRSTRAFACALLAVTAMQPVFAQDSAADANGNPGNDAATPDAYENTVFDGDFITIGAGAFYGPSYSGSDDYVVSPVPLIQGSLGGVSINPRPAGLALDFIPDADGSTNLALGIAGRLNRNRVTQIKDPVVRQYGKLETSVMVGPTAGVSFPGVLNPYDSLSFNVDALWDVAGGNNGMTVSPSVTYFTPLSRGMAASLSLSATHIDDDYADYYYSVPDLASVPAADRLAPFQAEGGWESFGANLLLGADLDGDLTNGGLAIFAIGGYSRLLGDAKRSPFTSVRGSADQFLIGAGVGYTF